MIIRLSDENISEYIDLPQFISAKRDLIPLGQFADLLRLMLLTTYGGIWLDVCVLLTGKIPNGLINLEEASFFMYQRDANEQHIKYWENSFAYYFGWYKGFKVNVLNGIMIAKADNRVIKDLCAMLLAFWQTHDRIPDYFFFQILFDLYITKHPTRNCKIVNDCIPHMLRQIINAEYPFKTIGEVLKITPIHSLNYKNPNAVSRLKEVLDLMQ